MNTNLCRQAALALALFVTSFVLTADKKPNILWLISEDMGPELACYGTPEVSTPTLDRLAKQGVRYVNAFTVTPVCSTSRSSFMTGMNACSIGAHQHRTPNDRKQMLPEGVRLLTGWLKEKGYYTANIRKINNKVKGTGKTDWNFKFPAKDTFDGSDWAELKNNQPFYAQVNFSESHRGFTAPEKADPVKVKLPPYYPDHPEARKDWAKYLDEVTHVDTHVNNILKLLDADGLADNTIVVFMGDHGRAHVRGKQWCYDSGLRVPLIIRWAKNYPAPAGFEPGTVDDRLIASIDVTATTLVEMAGANKPEKMQGRVFLGEHREADRDFVFATRDRCDMTTFHIRTVRDKRYRYIRNYQNEKPFLQWNRYKEASYPMIALMRQLHKEGKLDEVQAKLFAPSRPKEELYDTKTDPFEIHNLADDPKHNERLVALRTRLESWMNEVGDQGPEPPDIQAIYQEHVDKKIAPDRKPKKKPKKK